MSKTNRYGFLLAASSNNVEVTSISLIKQILLRVRENISITLGKNVKTLIISYQLKIVDFLEIKETHIFFKKI